MVKMSREMVTGAGKAFKRAKYLTISARWRPSQVVRERIAAPFYLVRLQGPPPFFLFRIRLLDKTKQ
jgi:hypothetical protein